MGKDDPLASQMIGFVQKLPGEWHQKYRDICSRAGHARKDSIGKLIYAKAFAISSRQKHNPSSTFV